MSLYYTITNRIKFELLTVAFNVLQYPANIHFSPTKYSIFFYLSDIAPAWNILP